MGRPAYSDTSLSAGQSQTGIQRLFAKYGVETFGIIQQAPGSFEIAFKHKGLPVKLPFTAEGVAAAMLRAEPWTSRRHCTQQEHREKIVAQAEKVVWRQAFYYLKAVFEAVEYGLLSFEAAFLHGYVTPTGQTVGEVLVPQLERVVTQRCLPAAEK